MVSLLAPNMSVGPDPANLLVNSAAPANVELVVVDGRILKRDGRLTHMDTRRALQRAQPRSRRCVSVPTGEAEVGYRSWRAFPDCGRI